MVRRVCAVRNSARCAWAGELSVSPATTTAAATATSAAARCAAATTAAAVFRARFVHGERAPAEDRSMQGVDDLLRLALIRHLYECESTGLTRHAIRDDGDLGDGSTVGFEQR